MLYFVRRTRNSCHLEVYPRVDGSVYLCGIGGSDHVRGARLREGGDLQDASLMKANPDRVAAAVASFQGMAPFARGQTPKIEQACMRPCAPDAMPVLGLVPGHGERGLRLRPQLLGHPLGARDWVVDQRARRGWFGEGDSAA